VAKRSKPELEAFAHHIERIAQLRGVALEPTVNIGWAWCKRTYSYVVFHISAGDALRSTTTTLSPADKWRLTANDALSPAMPAPKIQTSQSTTACGVLVSLITPPWSSHT
jgi:hypothetical protein